MSNTLKEHISKKHYNDIINTMSEADRRAHLRPNLAYTVLLDSKNKYKPFICRDAAFYLLTNDGLIFDTDIELKTFRCPNLDILKDAYGEKAGRHLIDDYRRIMFGCKSIAKFNKWLEELIYDSDFSKYDYNSVADEIKKNTLDNNDSKYSLYAFDDYLVNALKEMIISGIIIETKVNRIYHNILDEFLDNYDSCGISGRVNSQNNREKSLSPLSFIFSQTIEKNIYMWYNQNICA